jgi:hypothetical protein
LAIYIILYLSHPADTLVHIYIILLCRLSEIYLHLAIYERLHILLYFYYLIYRHFHISYLYISLSYSADMVGYLSLALSISRYIYCILTFLHISLYSSIHRLPVTLRIHSHIIYHVSTASYMIISTFLYLSLHIHLALYHLYILLHLLHIYTLFLYSHIYGYLYTFLPPTGDLLCYTLISFS